MTGTRFRLASGTLAACFLALAATPAGLAQSPRLATMAQQKMCADQAKKFFNDSQALKSTKPAIVLFPASYVDHYDAKANVCYVAVVTFESIDSGKTTIYSTVVSDAFENTSYANYNTTSDRIKSWVEAKAPLICTVEPPGQPEITCKSEHEFNALIKKYFGLIVR
ncbi:MAG TPA: hypothetical protein VGW37_04715 [Terriglobia bacterium]|nr:hypothetical protein [Terriglobia bacterium]